MKTRLVQSALLVVLLVIAVVVFFKLTDYSTRPGESGDAPAHLTDVRVAAVSWPATSSRKVQPKEFAASGQPTLLLFYHPKCPCTAATVRVLQRLQTRFTTETSIIAVAYCPENQTEDWVNSATTRTLSKLENTQVLVDYAGKMTQEFGVFVSGHLLLYTSDGHLTFSGGITPYRGHEGDGPASSDLLKRVNQMQSGYQDWTVYGCSIVTTRAPQR